MHPGESSAGGVTGQSSPPIPPSPSPSVPPPPPGAASQSAPPIPTHAVQSSVVGSSAAGSSGGSKGGRERFAADELAIVLSHFDIGVIDKIQEFPRGSRKAPKLVIKSEEGTYLLKRRARGKDDPYKVAFCHEIQLYLAQKQFPLPHLIGDRRDNNSMLQYKGTIYELFEYIRGTSYDNSLDATQDAGRILSLFHKLLNDFKSQHEPATGSYHASRHVNMAIERIPGTLAQANQASHEPQQLKQTLEYLHAAYNGAVMRIEELGMDDWPMQIVHSDWHPGNMLFRGHKVVAVIDYDAARIQQRIIDAANGALQFSIIGGNEDPATWPDYLDESRFKRFVRGYDSVPNMMLSKAELRCMPWLMAEALIAESVIPIASNGYFARMEGQPFLAMVERKVRWLHDNAGKLATVLDG